MKSPNPDILKKRHLTNAPSLKIVRKQLRWFSLSIAILGAIAIGFVAAPMPATTQTRVCSIRQITSGSGNSGVDVSMSSNNRWVAFSAANDVTEGNSDLNREIFLYDIMTNSYFQVTN